MTLSTNVDDIAALDLTTETPVIGDRTEYVQKMTALIAKVQGLSSSVSTLADQVQTLKGEASGAIDANAAAITASNNTSAAAIAAANNTISSSLVRKRIANILHNAGRCADDSGLQVTGYAALPDLRMYNGAAAAESVYGKFIYNNSTNGGGGDALSSEIDALTAALATAYGGGTGLRRFGPEYYPTMITAGGGTARARTFESSSWYPTFILEPIGVFPVPGQAFTFKAWVRVEGGHEIYASDGYLSLHIGGTSVSATKLTSADGWVHVAFTRISNRAVWEGGVWRDLFYSRISGHRYHMALPVLIEGVDVTPHTGVLY